MLLPIQRVRQLVGPDCPLDDAQLARLQEQLRALADLAIDQSGGLRAASTQCDPHATVLRLVPPERREEAEERAAIREYDGGMSRSRAERAAVADLGLTLNGAGPCRAR